MADQGKAEPHRGNMTPEELADPSKHQQQQIFETENRPPRSGETDSQAAEGREELGAVEPTAGQSAGPDTSGAVAHPAELNRPGASTKLGGTPSALATGSGGRQTH